MHRYISILVLGSSAVNKHLQSLDTHNHQKSRVLYHHQRKRSASAQTLTDEDIDQDCSGGEEKNDSLMYKWKRRIPASKFGSIIKEESGIWDQGFLEGIEKGIFLYSIFPLAFLFLQTRKLKYTVANM